jgi:hypothetical protein
MYCNLLMAMHAALAQICTTKQQQQQQQRPQQRYREYQDASAGTNSVRQSF